ncbi:MAG: ABC transporter permease [Erysipelotrichaceae bacterium]|jgi:ABC-type dipeptide/oligopeptide/nickel transport system permease subunit
MNRKIILQRMKKSKFFVLGVVGVFIIILLAIVSPSIIVHDPYKTDIVSKFIAPQWFSKGWSGHVLGTDSTGRDMLTRLLIGSRYSLSIALISAVISAFIGIVLGLLAGYYGGVVDMIIMRCCDIMNSFPMLLLAIVTVAMLGKSIPILIIVMSLCSWVGYTRLTRNNVMVVRNMEFIQAARALGAKGSLIMFREILSNVTTPLFIQFSQSVGALIKLEASLSFLNMGIQPPLPSWGSMISAGRSFIMVYPWVVLAPAACLAFTVLSFNFLGDGLRDVLDPKRF